MIRKERRKRKSKPTRIESIDEKKKKRNGIPGSRHSEFKSEQEI